MSRAKRAGIPFDPAIAADLADVPARCPACDAKMTFHVNDGSKSGSVDSPSIDRIIPALGYVPGNVQWLCGSCNATKSNGTMDELYERLAQRPAA